MTRRKHLANALVVVGIVLLVAPALFPVQQLLVHDTGAGTTANETELEREGYRAVAYENLSDRGRELYVRALRHGGEYAVPVGEGAPEFDYTTETRPQAVVVERPPDGDLPPADEPVEMVEFAAEREQRRGNESGPSVAERRRRIARYDVMSLGMGTPPLTATPNLLRLLSVVLGVVAIGTGGYRSSRP